MKLPNLFSVILGAVALLVDAAPTINADARPPTEFTFHLPDSIVSGLTFNLTTFSAALKSVAENKHNPSSSSSIENMAAQSSAKLKSTLKTQMPEFIKALTSNTPDVPVHSSIGNAYYAPDDPRSKCDLYCCQNCCEILLKTALAYEVCRELCTSMYDPYQYDGLVTGSGPA